jgi:multidrug efflux pump subunit AcrA (membrane-fusion protein)
VQGRLVEVDLDLVAVGHSPLALLLLTQQNINYKVSAVGTLTALNTATVRSKVDGELKAIRFTEGKQVKAGELLAEIDPRAFEVQVMQAQGQLAKDQALLKMQNSMGSAIESCGPKMPLPSSNLIPKRP